MKKLNEQARRDNYIMSLLKLESVAYELFKTDKGPVHLVLRKGGIGNDYFITHDAVPLEEKKSQEVLELMKLND